MAYLNDNCRLADAKRTGRPMATSEEDRPTLAAVVTDLFLSAKEIRQELSLSVSCSIRRRLKEPTKLRCSPETIFE
ncbi:hypothetical protein HPB49_009079 [Dermacentor silvarum]|uniref:Uncharacterized protein n=1 Tax=Dermacentor silvarum TaxID=543639 RepID=A0ACB8DYB8_DERSI|nr:hypothetical protein HPB49_009079 [Dermacentor silvarum]